MTLFAIIQKMIYNIRAIRTLEGVSMEQELSPMRKEQLARWERNSKRAAWTGTACLVGWIMLWILSWFVEPISIFVTQHPIRFQGLLVPAGIFFIIGICCYTADDIDEDDLYF
jgi:hypothetical protein